MFIFTHSSFCVLNFLPAGTPLFATAAHTTHKVKQTAVIILLIYCGVQVLPRYPTVCMNLKKFDTETVPFLSTCCATAVYSKGIIQPPFHLFSIPKIHRGGYRTCHYNNRMHSAE
jgi:hypothetical protein